MNKIFILLLAACIILSQAEWVKEMENEGYFEGDIELAPGEWPKEDSNNVVSYGSIRGGRWPNPVIYDGTGMGSSRNVRNAIASYEKHTCLRFKKRTNERSYIRFYKGSGCHSPVGYYPGRVNSISLGFGCGTTGITIHEMGHSLGLYHEQSRPDRDKYVKILYGNIVKGHEHNFRKHSYGRIDSLGTPYDYNSIMHYGKKSFGKGILFKSTTIETLDKSKQNVIGQRRGLSKVDIQQLNLMYCKGGNGGGTTPTKTPPPSGCGNNHANCDMWASRTPSECTKNPNYMLKMCKKACKVCS